MSSSILKPGFKARKITFAVFGVAKKGSDNP
jgi:hypothetical protein